MPGRRSALAPAIGRTDLPLFLATLLREVIDSHDQVQVFVGADGTWHRRSNFARRLGGPPATASPISTGRRS